MDTIARALAALLKYRTEIGIPSAVVLIGGAVKWWRDRQKRKRDEALRLRNEQDKKRANEIGELIPQLVRDVVATFQQASHETDGRANVLSFRAIATSIDMTPEVAEKVVVRMLADGLLAPITSSLYPGEVRYLRRF